MLRASIVGLVLLSAACLMAQPLVEKPLGSPEQERFFEVSIKQEGRTLPVVDGKVRLHRRPFQVVIRMKAHGAVQLNASTNPKLHQAARAGTSVAAVIPLAGTGMAEHDFNPDRDLFLSNQGYHYLHHMGPKSHRFDEVRPDGSGFVCFRSVDKLSGLGAGKGTPISSFRAEVLYLVLVKSQYDAERMDSVAQQVEHLALVFR